MIDPIEKDLNDHLSQLDKEDDYNSAIEAKTLQVFDDLKHGATIYIGNDTYSMSDFIADVEINDSDFCKFINGCMSELHIDMLDKLNKFAKEIAVKIISHKK